MKNSSSLRTIVLHILVWVGILSLAFFLESFIDRPLFKMEHETIFKAYRIVSILSVALVFYFNVYYLLPKTTSPKKWVVFTIINICIVFIYSLISHQFLEKTMSFLQPIDFRLSANNYFVDELDKVLKGKRLIPPYWTAIFPFLIGISASLAYYFISTNIRSEKQRREEKMEALTSELQFLKSQVSPHFLFNILNSFTYLARTKSEILEAALLKLSSLLRYMIYETNDATTELSKEINYLQDYIELQKLRYHDLTINTNLNAIDKTVTIAPMILIPFVENAFKHATLSDNQNGFVQISLKMYNNHLFFFVANSYDGLSAYSHEKDSGIGLVNVTKRLDLLYLGRYMLNIERQEKVFTVSLEIPLKNLYED